MKTKQQLKREERAKNKAASLRSQSDAAFDHARKSIEHIPFGQPILVGHHSEKHHRRDLAKHDRAIRKAVDIAEEAKRAEWSIGGSGRAILSNDPEAIQALTAKLEGLERKRDAAKELNRKAKKKKEELPVPSYWFTNRGAEIRRLKKRIAELEQKALEPERDPVNGEGWIISEDSVDDRVRVTFDHHLTKDEVQTMKRFGFRWSRFNTAWQRQLTNAGRVAAETVVKILTGPHE